MNSGTNATFAELGEIVKNHQRFVLLSHVRPDGDAIGSQLALASALRGLGKEVWVWNEDGMQAGLAFLPASEWLTLPPEQPLEDVDVVFALDTANYERLGARCLHAISHAKKLVVVDHHKSNTRYGDVNFVDSTSPAAGQIIYEWLTALDWPIDEISRDAMYTAISTDTNSLRYPAASFRTYEIMTDLVRRGVDVGVINQAIYQNNPYRRLQMLGALLGSLESRCGGRVLSWDLTQQVQQSLELAPDDSEGAIDMIRSVQGVEVAVYFEELGDGKIRVSLRSKDVGVFDASEFAAIFGGGGHALAAGIRMSGPLSSAKQRLFAALDAHFGA